MANILGMLQDIAARFREVSPRPEERPGPELSQGQAVPLSAQNPGTSVFAQQDPGVSPSIGLEDLASMLVPGGVAGKADAMNAANLSARAVVNEADPLQQPKKLAHTPPPSPRVQETYPVPMGVAAPQQDPASDFLMKIGKLESQNRDNVIHPIIKQGINKGTRAIGRYGLTPLTIVSTLREMQAKGIADDLPEVPKREPKTLTAKKKEAVAVAAELSPRQQHTLAYYLTDRLLNQTEGDQERAALLWNSGTNRPQKQLTGALLDKHEYVQKFRKLVQRENSGVPQLQEESRIHPGAVAITNGENAFQTQRLMDEAISRSLAKRLREK